MEIIREHLRDEIYGLVQLEDVIAEPCGTEPTVGIRILLATRFFPTVNGVSLYSASKPTAIHRTYLIFVGWNDNSYYYPAGTWHSGPPRHGRSRSDVLVWASLKQSFNGCQN